MIRKSGDLPSHENSNPGGVPWAERCATHFRARLALTIRRSAEGAMYWTTQTHGLTATICPHIGRPCPAATAMAEALSTAVSRAVAASGPDFEISGSSEIRGCERCCTTRFFATAQRIRLFCDVSEDAPIAPLHRCADMVFGPADASPVADMPRSTMIEARPRANAIHETGRRPAPALP